MLPIYNSGAEVIETVYTYDEWLKEYNHRKDLHKAKQRAERIFTIKQRLAGLMLAAAGLLFPFLLNGDATISVVLLPLGIFLLLTKEKVVMF